MALFTAILLALILGRSDVPTDAVGLAAASQAAVEAAGPLRGRTAAETVAVMLVTYEEETRFSMAPAGDHGHSHCAGQIWGPASDVDTIEKCARATLEHMRESDRIDHSAPLAQYCGGVSVPMARRISARRISRALALVRAATTLQAGLSPSAPSQ